METQKQIRDWSDLYKYPLSKEEHREISQNLEGFFNTLRRWDRQAKNQPRRGIQKGGQVKNVAV